MWFFTFIQVHTCLTSAFLNVHSFCLFCHFVSLRVQFSILHLSVPRHTFKIYFPYLLYGKTKKPKQNFCFFLLPVSFFCYWQNLFLCWNRSFSSLIQHNFFTHALLENVEFAISIPCFLLSSIYISTRGKRKDLVRLINHAPMS